MTKSTIVIGLGNPSLGDDGVGWRVVETLQKILGNTRLNVDFDCLAVGGLQLMERLEGYERAILVDAVEVDSEIGQVHRYALDDLPGGHTGDLHSTTLQQALATGRGLGLLLPAEIVIVGIAIRPNLDFSESLSAPVKGSLMLALKAVMSLL
ncbi:MAG: hydrogenase maturation protease [Anaerolineaceae bacterium]|nr:hydrogenase maturation protease [Anaerolineaceae bacterium]